MSKKTKKYVEEGDNIFDKVIWLHTIANDNFELYSCSKVRCSYDILYGQ